MTGFWSFQSPFDRKYGGPLHDRWPTFKIALNWLHRTKGLVIVETGTLRREDSMDGGSTILFGDYCLTHEARLFTVDVDAGHLELSKRRTQEYAGVTTYVHGDSVEFLRGFTRPIHLLYLDSFDYDENDPAPAQRHALKEIEAALPKLTPRACVLIDDNRREGGGKGELVKGRLEAEGFACLLDLFQSVWVRF